MSKTDPDETNQFALRKSAGGVKIKWTHADGSAVWLASNGHWGSWPYAAAWADEEAAMAAAGKYPVPE